MTNPITKEIREIRHRLAANFDNDLDRIVDDLQRQQRESGLQYVDLPESTTNKTDREGVVDDELQVRITTRR